VNKEIIVMTDKKRTFLRERRNEMGLTQEKVARELDISTTYYNQIETGSRNPKLKLAIKISEFFLLDIKKL
jgi:putative transcriptional regulator